MAEEIPVYLFTGFMDSGKTSLIKDTIFENDFANGSKGLIIMCEDGDVDGLEKKIDSMTEELTNQIYRTRENRRYCKEHGLRLSGPKLGRPSATAKVDKKQEYQDNTDRIEVERTFRLSKRCYGMSCITAKLEETQLTSIALSVFVTNLFRIQRRILCALLHLFQFCHDWNRCKSWKLQISA